MPRVVLMAKNTYVWLDQLSQAIRRARSAASTRSRTRSWTRWRAAGFTGLWLIGLWERSRASQQIKQLRGNPEAVASAYSLIDYRIADDLGGEEAFAAPASTRAWRAASAWPATWCPTTWASTRAGSSSTRTGSSRCRTRPYPVVLVQRRRTSRDDDRVGDPPRGPLLGRTPTPPSSSSAIDHWTGDVRYIYHGNDGTSMPWNDTAQLDYLKPEVREAVIQTILHVARQFPIIRFDAAMTLAKQPHPAALVSRARAAAAPSRRAPSTRMTQGRVRRAHAGRVLARGRRPRRRARCPDTLLLAEAFWLMEGYFVRTLGMHRVYNSAFMNMLTRRGERRTTGSVDQEHARVRPGDPQALRQLHEQPGRARRRSTSSARATSTSASATLMATLPGLPMFGHGQIEGFTEKYGMEYRRAYRDEQPDGWLVERHEREIFPLLHRRYLFAEVDGLPALRLLRPGRPGQRGRLRLLEPARRRARPGRLPQPLRRGEGLDQGHPTAYSVPDGRRAAAGPEDRSARGSASTRTATGTRSCASSAPAWSSFAAAADLCRDGLVRRVACLRLPGIPGHPRARGWTVRAAAAGSPHA